MKIFIFNPEHDYALADFSKSYNPPKQIKALRANGALTQLPLLNPGDSILLLDPPTENTLRFKQENSFCPLLSLNDLHSLFGKNGRFGSYGSYGICGIFGIFGNVGSIDSIEFIPWGWDPAMKHTLRRHGVPEALLPSDDYLLFLRQLSHRRSSIRFQEILSQLASPSLKRQLLLPKIAEISNPDEARTLLSQNPLNPISSQSNQKAFFFKAPWSSSGRGILCSAGLPLSRILPWINGIIAKQGSVICEPAADKALDFATEWLITPSSSNPAEKSISQSHNLSDSHPQFLGFSVFEASERGKYHGNIDAPQSRLREIIQNAAPGVNLDELIAIQQRALAEVAAGYSGYVGIDMLADTQGRIRPCIELNFRTTMGIVSLKSAYT